MSAQDVGSSRKGKHDPRRARNALAPESRAMSAPARRPPPPAALRAGRLRIAVIAAALALATTLAYRDSFRGPFLIDDGPNIKASKAIRPPHSLVKWMETKRPVVTATLAWQQIGEGASRSAGFDLSSVSPWQYLRWQLGVLPYYLRLAVWPDRLCFDCGLDGPWPVVTGTLSRCART